MTNFNLSKIYTLPRLRKPNSGLTFKRGRWWMIYYPEEKHTRLLDLKTTCVEEARLLQKRIYRQCEERNCLPQTRMQKKAEEILKHPHCNVGIVHSVHFGGVKSPTFPTVAQARNFRNNVAKKIVNEIK